MSSLEISLLFPILFIHLFIVITFLRMLCIVVTLWCKYFYISFKACAYLATYYNFYFNLCIIPVNLMCFNLLTYHPQFGNFIFVYCRRQYAVNSCFLSYIQTAGLSLLPIFKDCRVILAVILEAVCESERL